MLIPKYDSESNRKAWQEFLKSRGHDVQPDGIWGPKTEAATKNFQTIRGLRSDGIVGDNTIAEATKAGFVGFAVEGQTEPPKNPGVKTVLVSAGHSTVPPRDPGAQGNGFTESYLALELRDLVADKLRALGVRVVEDGQDGQSLPLTKAIGLIRDVSPSVAVEFHWNAGPPTATGIEVLCKPKHKTRAQDIAYAIASATGLRLRGDRGWKADDSGQHERLGFCEAGGLVVEVCFISSKVDMTAYTNHKIGVASNLAKVLAS